MKKLLPLLLPLLLSGCAHFASIQTEIAPDGTKRITDVSSTTFFDSKSDLARLRASTSDKSQSVNIGSLYQESNTTNLVNIIGAVAEGMAKGMKP